MADMGTIMARLGLDDSRFKTGVNNAGKWGKAKFAAIGGAMAGAFAASFGVSKIKEMITAAKDIKTFGQQAGISAEEFQKLNAVIAKGNGDASDTVSIMLDLKRAMADARTGNAQWVKDFESLGISMDMIKKDDPVALFKAIGMTVAKSAQLTGEQVNALGRMMGEDTSARAIAGFRKNFVGTMEEFNVVSQESIDAAEEIDFLFKRLGQETMVEVLKIINDNKEGIKSVLELTIQAVGKVGETIQAVKFLKEETKNLTDPVTQKGDPLKTSWYMPDKLQKVLDEAMMGYYMSFVNPTKDLANMPLAFDADRKDKLRREQLVEYFKSADHTLKSIDRKMGNDGLSGNIMGM